MLDLSKLGLTPEQIQAVEFGLRKEADAPVSARAQAALAVLKDGKGHLTIKPRQMPQLIVGSRLLIPSTELQTATTKEGVAKLAEFRRVAAEIRKLCPEFGPRGGALSVVDKRAAVLAALLPNARPTIQGVAVSKSASAAILVVAAEAFSGYSLFALAGETQSVKDDGSEGEKSPIILPAPMPAAQQGIFALGAAIGDLLASLGADKEQSLLMAKELGILPGYAEFMSTFRPEAAAPVQLAEGALEALATIEAARESKAPGKASKPADKPAEVTNPVEQPADAAAGG